MEVNKKNIIKANDISVDEPKTLAKFKEAKTSQYLLQGRLIDTSAITKNISKLMNYLSPIIINTDNLKEIISPNVKYVVQIPTEIMNRINTGEYDFMRSGEELIANVVDKTRPKSPVVKQLRMVQESTISPQALSDIRQMAQNIAIQQQLAVITERLDEIADKAERILSGQMTDRLGFIYGAWDTYQQALCINNAQLSNSLKMDVIQSLNIGRQQLIQYVDSQDNFFRGLPTTEIGAFVGNLNGKLIKRCADVLNSCNQALTGIALSTALLSSIYISYDETDVLKILFNPLKELIEERRGDLLLTAAIAGQQDNACAWVIDPNESERFLNQIIRPLEIIKGDFIEIEIAGSELIAIQEGINDGR